LKGETYGRKRARLPSDVRCGIEINAGVPITLNPHTKLVLVENDKEEEENDTAFAASALFNPDRTRASPTSDALLFWR
jgi:hypothetical protein